MKDYQSWALWIFNATYLFWGGAYFLQDLNFEFVIYVAVIVVIIGSVLLTAHKTEFPAWQLWLLSLWGVMHVLGGAVVIDGGVLFGYHIYPLLDLGGDFYILKYDQVVHAYLYGLVAVMAFFQLRRMAAASSIVTLLFISVLISEGISALNEIMEFLIAVSIEENGVGGYENAMLDLMFNLGGALVAASLYAVAIKLREKFRK